MRKFIGCCLIASVFIAIFTATAIQVGFWGAMLVWGIAFLLAVMLFGGAWLIAND